METQIKNNATDIPTAEQAKVIIAEAQVKQELLNLQSYANELANKEPLPSVATKIINPKPIPVTVSTGETLSIRPCLNNDFIIFEKTKNIMHEIVRGNATYDDLMKNYKDSMAIVYQYLHPIREVDKLTDDMVAFQEKYMELGYIYNTRDIIDLVTAIVIQVSLSLAARGALAIPDTTASDTKTIIKKK